MIPEWLDEAVCMYSSGLDTKLAVGYDPWIYTTRYKHVRTLPMAIGERRPWCF